MSVSTNQTFARLPEGNFIARIFTSNIGYTASPRLSFSNLIQYDNRSRNLGWQSRVRWTLQPGNDFFLAFNQGWIQEEEREPEPAVPGAGHQAVGEVPVLAQVLMRSVALLARPVDRDRVRDGAAEPASEPPAPVSRELGAWTGTGNTTLGFVSESGIVPHHVEGPEPGQRAAGGVSADAPQRHQRPADESDRRPPGCRRRQRRVRRRPPHVRISRRVERHRLVNRRYRKRSRRASESTCREVSPNGRKTPIRTTIVVSQNGVEHERPVWFSTETQPSSGCGGSRRVPAVAWRCRCAGSGRRPDR